MKTVYHKVRMNVTDGSSTPALDIPQGDYYSHNIIMELHEDNKPYDISGLTPSLQWYDSSNNKVIVSEVVKVINPVRGQLSYIPAGPLLHSEGRYTVVLRLKGNLPNSMTSRMSVRFIVNVTKDAFFEEDEEYEMTISKEMYDDMKEIVNQLEWHEIKENL